MAVLRVPSLQSNKRELAGRLDPAHTEIYEKLEADIAHRRAVGCRSAGDNFVQKLTELDSKGHGVVGGDPWKNGRVSNAQVHPQLAIDDGKQVTPHIGRAVKRTRL
jgi:hypothetical protein